MDVDVLKELLDPITLRLDVRHFEKAMENARLAFKKFADTIGGLYVWTESHAKRRASERSLRNSPSPYGYITPSWDGHIYGMSTMNRKRNKHGRFGIDGRVKR